MNNKSESELDQKFQILDSKTENNKSKIITMVVLISIATLIFLSNLYYDSKTNKNNDYSANTHPQVHTKQKDKIIKAQREGSQEFLKTAKTALQELDRFNLKDWNPIKNQELKESFKNGESMHRLRRYFEANRLFKDIIIESNSIISAMPEKLETKIQEGYFFIENNKPLAAIESFNYALKIEPSNERALKGLKIATNFNEVESLFTQADEFEMLGRNTDALKTYYKIIELDPTATKAQYAINRIEFNKKEKAYLQLYNKGHTHLQNKRFREARQSFQEAQKMFPSRKEVKDSLSETLRAETDYLINKYIKEARIASTQNDWITALKNYEKALKLDNSLEEGLKGLNYSIRRNKLNQQIMSILNNNEYPLKQTTFEKTREILKLALAHKDESVVASQIDELNKILAEMKKKVPVLFISDNQTYVKLANNINLGAFKSQKFRLTPGKYLVMGERKGFQEVSKNFIVSTDKKDNRVYIICKQKQRI